MTLEIINVIVNLLISSGLVTVLIFYRQNQRKASAEATTSEHEADKVLISNYHDALTDLRIEKTELKADLKEREKQIDRLYIEKGDDRKIILSLTEQLSEEKIAAIKTHCDVKKCTDRHPYTGY